MSDDPSISDEYAEDSDVEEALRWLASRNGIGAKYARTIRRHLWAIGDGEDGDGRFLRVLLGYERLAVRSNESLGRVERALSAATDAVERLAAAEEARANADRMAVEEARDARLSAERAAEAAAERRVGALVRIGDGIRWLLSTPGGTILLLALAWAVAQALGVSGLVGGGR